MDYQKLLSEQQRSDFEEALDLMVRKTVEDERRIGIEFPYVTNDAGAWRTWPASVSAGYDGDAWSHGNWFCGFWVGLLLACHLRSGEKDFLDWARERMRLVEPRADDANTHDIGFIFCGSAVPFFRLTGEIRHAETALRAADRLRARLINTPRGGFISSWGPLSDERGRRSSAIDTMANLPLLYWAAEKADDGSFRLAGESHARMTREAFIRPDGWTYHAVEYDLWSGNIHRGYTFQGYGDESRWTRGQAWAIYGYTATAAATGKLEYLELAGRLADSYLRHLDGSRVPFWDADDPAIPNAIRDSSAAAIAASAMLEMAALYPLPGDGRRWAGEGIAILESLCRDYLAREGAHRGLLKHACYSKPHGEGTDSAVMFGDYFFVEALCRIFYPGTLSALPSRLGQGVQG